MAASGRRGCDCPHHSDTGAGTNTNGVEVEVDGRPRENGEVDVEVGGGLGYRVVIVSHGMCISETYSGGVRMPEQQIQRTCQYWLDASTHSSPGE